MEPFNVHIYNYNKIAVFDEKLQLLVAFFDFIFALSMVDGLTRHFSNILKLATPFKVNIFYQKLRFMFS